MSTPKIAVFAAGEKGRAFLAAILREVTAEVLEVRTYKQPRTLDDADSAIAELCNSRNIPVFIGARNPTEIGVNIDIVFIVGWQYLLPRDPRLVVFHDGLLPRFRGFAPTVSALIAGEAEIGVTALQPIDEPDAGPILTTHAQQVTYPIKIRDALERLTESYIICANDVIRNFSDGSFSGTPQDHSAATYSVWRDDEDFRINWSDDALRICRTVDALGWPYQGARTQVGSTPLTILDAIPGPDLRFELNQPGKLWSISEGIGTVICGRGTVVLRDVRDADGNPYRFERLRVRLN